LTKAKVIKTFQRLNVNPSNHMKRALKQAFKPKTLFIAKFVPIYRNSMRQLTKK